MKIQIDLAVYHIMLVKLPVCRSVVARSVVLPKGKRSNNEKVKVKVKQSGYRPEQAQRVDRGIALPFRDLGVRRGVWGSTPGKDPVPIVQEAGWAPEPVWTCAKNLAPAGFDPRTVQPVASRYTD
jgi:hypothetical protein